MTDVIVCYAKCSPCQPDLLAALRQQLAATTSAASHHRIAAEQARARLAKVRRETTDRDLLRALARHLRKHDLGCFDPDGDDQVRAHALVDWFAESVDVLNVPASGDDQMAAPSPKAVEDGWACLTCGSPRWVAASLTGPVSYGGRAIRQCVPCGRYSNDPVPGPSRATQAGERGEAEGQGTAEAQGCAERASTVP